MDDEEASRTQTQARDERDADSSGEFIMVGLERDGGEKWHYSNPEHPEQSPPPPRPPPKPSSTVVSFEGSNAQLKRPGSPLLAPRPKQRDDDEGRVTLHLPVSAPSRPHSPSSSIGFPQRPTRQIIHRTNSSPGASPSHTPRSGSPTGIRTAGGRRQSTAARVVEAAYHHSVTTYHFLAALRPSQLWLVAYFFASVSLTISTKFMLRSFFPFPWILTAMQMLFALIFTQLSSFFGIHRIARLSPNRESWALTCCVLFSFEILASNISLKMVPVPYHLSVRALSPILTLVLNVVFFDQKTTIRASSYLLLVALGVVFTSHNMDLDSFGSLLTITSALLSSAKTIVTNRLLYDTWHIHPFDLLSRVAPLGLAHSTLIAFWNGELRRLWSLTAEDFTTFHIAVLLFNGSISFFLVVIALITENKTRAPSMSISSHAAQAFTILVAAFFFSLSLNVINFVGIFVTLAGGILYAHYDAVDFPPSAPPLENKAKLLPD
ncbi:UAA transporter family protein [Pseudohyphozyma bogoriensis]|nr:UAA transporter family protein [Pseudohyphozyma bogoriensis]